MKDDKQAKSSTAAPKPRPKPKKGGVPPTGGGASKSLQKAVRPTKPKASSVVRPSGIGIGLRGFGHEIGYDTKSGLYYKQTGALAHASRTSGIGSPGGPSEHIGGIGPRVEERGRIHPNHVSAAKSGYMALKSIGYDPNADTYLSFDEVVTTVSSTGPGNYTYAEFDVNPGNSLLFPMTSAKMAGFEEWMLVDFECYYTALASDQTTGGRVIISLDLEGAQEPPPATAVAQENNSIHADGKAYEDFGVQLAGVIPQFRRYVNTGRGYPGSSNPKLIDGGRITVGVLGVNAGDVGQLRVRGRVIGFDAVQEDTTVPTLPLCVQGFEFLGTYSYPTATLSQVLFGPNTLIAPGWVQSGNTLLAPRTSWYRVQINGTIHFSSAAGSEFNFRLWAAGVGPIALCYSKVVTGLIEYAPFNIDTTVSLSKDDALELDLTPIFTGGTCKILAHGVLGNSNVTITTL